MLINVDTEIIKRQEVFTEDRQVDAEMRSFQAILYPFTVMGNTEVPNVSISNLFTACSVFLDFDNCC